MNWGINEKGTNEMWDQWDGGPMSRGGGGGGGGGNEMGDQWNEWCMGANWGINEMGDQWDGGPMMCTRPKDDDDSWGRSDQRQGIVWADWLDFFNQTSAVALRDVRACLTQISVYCWTLSTTFKEYNNTCGRWIRELYIKQQVLPRRSARFLLSLGVFVLVSEMDITYPSRVFQRAARGIHPFSVMRNK